MFYYNIITEVIEMAPPEPVFRFYGKNLIDYSRLSMKSLVGKFYDIPGRKILIGTFISKSYWKPIQFM